jgi:hypothetical protein
LQVAHYSKLNQYWHKANAIKLKAKVA